MANARALSINGILTMKLDAAKSLSMAAARATGIDLTRSLYAGARVLMLMQVSACFWNLVLASRLILRVGEPVD